MNSKRDQVDATLLLLSEHIDGELDEPSRLRAEKLLAEDAGLRAERDALLRTDQLIRRHAVAVPDVNPDEFVRQVNQRRTAARTGGSWTHRLLGMRRYAAAASVVFVVTAGIYVANVVKTSDDRGSLRLTILREGQVDAAAETVASVSRTMPDGVATAQQPAHVGKVILVFMPAGGDANSLDAGSDETDLDGLF